MPTRSLIPLIFLAMLCSVVGMFSSFDAIAEEAKPERRVALVLGNSSYATMPPLRNASGDARAIATQLESLGFEVVSGYDLSKSETQATIARFAKVVRGADVALFFYAGHGLQVSGVNYLLPTDAVLEDDTSLDFDAVSLNFVLRQLSRDTKVRLVFLDACRDNPLLFSGDEPRFQAIKGLAEVHFEDAGNGTLVVFATSPNEVAYDGSGEHSPFTAALLEHLDDENVQLTTVMTRITGAVYRNTAGRQRPWVNASLIDEVILNRVTASEPLIVGAAEQGTSEDDSSKRSLPAQETTSTQEQPDDPQVTALNVMIPELPSEDPIAFQLPIEFGDPAIDGKSIAELIRGKPRFPPIEGLDDHVWDHQCSSCHEWTQSSLCEQARMYERDRSAIMRLPHPLGFRFKVALGRWAEEGCK